MVANDKNPGEVQQQQLQKEKKIIVHSLRGEKMHILPEPNGSSIQVCSEL